MLQAYRFFEMMARKEVDGAVPQTIDLLQLIFDSVSNLTFGLIDDVASLVLGVLCLVFLQMGIDLLKTVLEHRSANRRRDNYLDKAREYRHQRDWSDEVGSVDHEFHDLKYKQYLKKAAEQGD